MLHRDPQSQRLYLHDAVTEKESAESSDGHLIPTGPLTTNSELYTTNILLSEEKTDLRRIQNNLNTTNAQIRKAQDEVIKLENYKVVRKILQQARGIVEKESRQRGIDELKAYKAKRDERDSVVKHRESVAKNARKLSDMLIKNTDKEHIQEGLKTVVGDFLSTIDFSSKRSMNGGEATKKDKQFLTSVINLLNAAGVDMNSYILGVGEEVIKNKNWLL